ncbi:uncharacterized protein N7515_001626 [Penicillium bovifimosum]|uniref:Uncharacterized protein n=1 Tax=Penicillium bovifimosum TaxID=126998 RepID=A0A9W9HA25_9EURO|nr:uncharacterized protein N7515_001626 [Penicillium bovifimosum]KAJ5142839.1 hypothetical protein N7515_001626 [Penicillium bovifimosum]
MPPGITYDLDQRALLSEELKTIMLLAYSCGPNERVNWDRVGVYSRIPRNSARTAASKGRRKLADYLEHHDGEVSGNLSEILNTSQVEHMLLAYTFQEPQPVNWDKVGRHSGKSHEEAFATAGEGRRQLELYFRLLDANSSP